MQAMLLSRILGQPNGNPALEYAAVPQPAPGNLEILIKVSACGVCHTEWDEIEGRTPPPRLPVIPGHQAVGRIEKAGPGARRFQPGDRVGVGWFFSACGACRFCRTGRENLCRNFLATGRDANGGYAEYLKVPQASAFPIPDIFTDAQAAPLLCAGAVGYRAVRLSGLRDGQNIGLAGFGGSGHLVLQLLKYRFPRSNIFVFARSGREREFSRELGAVWAGDTGETPPEKLHVIIDTTPAWKPVVEALRHLERGGRLVINAIRKEDADRDQLLRLDYAEHLWLEKEIISVANVTPRDIAGFLPLAAAAGIRPEVELFPLAEANRALRELKRGGIRGAKVLVM